MANVVVLTFDNPDEAGRLRQTLRELEREGRLELDDAAVVVKDARGTVRVRGGTRRRGKLGAVGGGLLGAVLFALFPAAGAAVGPPPPGRRWGGRRRADREPHRAGARRGVRRGGPGGPAPGDVGALPGGPQRGRERRAGGAAPLPGHRLPHLARRGPGGGAPPGPPGAPAVVARGTATRNARAAPPRASQRLVGRRRALRLPGPE